jgi:hypothetical protein
MESLYAETCDVQSIQLNPKGKVGSPLRQFQPCNGHGRAYTPTLSSHLRAPPHRRLATQAAAQWILARFSSLRINCYRHRSATCGVDSTINVPSRFWRRLLLRLLHGELAKMGYFASLAMIAGPLSGALALPLAQGVDTGLFYG